MMEELRSPAASQFDPDPLGKPENTGQVCHEKKKEPTVHGAPDQPIEDLMEGL